MPEGKPALLCKAGATDSISLTLTKRVWIMPEDVRKALEDSEVAGVSIKKGDNVLVVLSAANRVKAAEAGSALKKAAA